MYINRGCLNRNNMVFQEIVASYTIYEMHFSSSAPQREMGQNKKRNRNRREKSEAETDTEQGNKKLLMDVIGLHSISERGMLMNLKKAMIMMKLHLIGAAD